MTRKKVEGAIRCCSQDAANLVRRDAEYDSITHVCTYGLHSNSLSCFSKFLNIARECKYGSGAEYYVQIREKGNHQQEQNRSETTRETTTSQARGMFIDAKVTG